MLRENTLKEENITTSNYYYTKCTWAEEIVNFKILTEDDVNRAGKFIIDEVGCKSVVIKGGHLTGEAKDYLFLMMGLKKYGLVKDLRLIIHMEQVVPSQQLLQLN